MATLFMRIMSPTIWKRTVWVASLFASALTAAAQTTAPAPLPDTQPAGNPLTFTVTYDPKVTDNFTGRVYVMTSAAGAGEPRYGPAWMNTQPFFALDVVDWKPNTPLVFDDRALAFPDGISALPEQDYSIQAVLRRNLDSPAIGTAEGNGYSDVLRQKLMGASTGNLALHIDQVAKARSFHETKRLKLVELKSDLLSAFHKRDIIMRAAVILPPGYDDDPKHRYPVLYWIGGFGGTHHDAQFMGHLWERTGYANRIVRIVLDPSCYGGHHVFADSENNGPRGQALIEEFIPHLEKSFRIMNAPTARFLSGHSSGGWSSLWLQVTYPEFFGGTWSIAPDPVDFRDFQRINLYRPGVNMYDDETGGKRALARAQEHVTILYETFARMEVPYGEGGQLRSFEWVFSRRGADGLPKPLYDRENGAVNADVAESWKRYDIRLKLEENWPALRSKLAGKINIFMGAEDTFYLDGATAKLKTTLAELGSDAVVEIEPGKDHGSIATAKLRERIDRELVEKYEKAHPEFALPVTTYD